MPKIREIEAFAYRVPLARPVQTSFGKMRDRPAVLLRLTDASGVHGWGEVFCNWPAAGAEHRARLVLEDLADLVFADAWDGAPALFDHLTAATHVKVLQTAEPGPFAQAIAGLDMAFSDLMARRTGQPLARFLAPAAPAGVPVYASGIQIDDAPTMIPAARAAGFRAFKIKVGFDIAADAEKTQTIAAALLGGELLMADANQAWNVDEAAEFLARIGETNLHWLEEPIRVDFPAQDWTRLAGLSRIPIAGGENLLGMVQFEDAAALGALSVIQPDAAKWGGVTGCLRVARVAEQAGRTYCPHFLGAGIGLLASAHILAASGSKGMLEVDVNPNPLRAEMLSGWPSIAGGTVTLPDGPGLGIDPDLTRLATYRTYQEKRTA